MDRRDDLVEGLVLRQARNRAGSEERIDLAQVRRRRQAHDGDVRAGLAQRLGRLDAVERRQPVVHHDDVGSVLAAELDDLRAVLDRGDDLDVRAQPEQQLERFPEHLVVLDEGDADPGFCAPSLYSADDQQRVVRLAAWVDLELELRMSLGDAREERPELGLLLAGDEGQDVSGLAEQALDDGVGDRVEARPPGDRLTVGEAE